MPHSLSIAAALFLQGAVPTPASVSPVAAAACSESNSMASVDYLFHVRSLEELTDSAKVIVDATVQSVGPGIPHGGISETDAQFTPNKVLKGPSTLGRFAVSQIRARGMLGIQPGQRFILFLSDETAIRLALLPDQPGVTRFGLIGDYSGLFCVEGDKLRLGSGSELKGKYEATPLSKALADIERHLDIPRLNGRINMDGGVLPPPEIIPLFRGSSLDPRAGFRIILTPTDANSATDTSPRRTMVLTIPPGFVEPAPVSGSRLVSIERNGTFSIPLERGAYRVSVEGIPIGYSIKSISLDSTDLLTEPLRIIGPVAADLRITLIGPK